MAGYPVVFVDSGGLPVTYSSDGNGWPIEEAASGLPVTEVASGGLPVTEGVRVVTPLQFGATGSMDDDDSAAIQAALDSGHRVLIDRFYRHLNDIIWPAYATVQFYGEPEQVGFVADMGTGLSHQIGGGVRIYGRGTVKSLAYPASALANDENWDIYCRGIRLTGGDVYIQGLCMEDLAGGLDAADQSGIQVDYLRGERIRTRYGWGAVFHAAGSLGGTIEMAEAVDCDRFLEPEDGSKHWTFNGGSGLRIYPPGYTGQPADGSGATDLNIGSYPLSAHSHPGTGACEDIVYRNFLIEQSLGAIRTERSGGSDANDLPRDITFDTIEVKSPKRVNRSAFGGNAAINFTPVHLQGVGQVVKNCRLTGTGESQLGRIIHTLGGSDDTLIDNFIADADSYHGRFAQFAGVNSTLRNSTIGRQAGSSTAVLIDVDANGAKILNNQLNGPRYHSVLYDFASGTSGCERKGNSYTPPPSNPPSAIVNYNGTTVDETGGNDDA